MNGPVLAFRKPKRRRRDHRWARAAAEIASNLTDMKNIDPACAARYGKWLVELSRGLLLITQQQQQHAQAAGNIGKPVITIDRDDREGA